MVVHKLGFLPVQSQLSVTAGDAAELHVLPLPSARRVAGASGTSMLYAELDSVRGVSVIELCARRDSGPTLIGNGRTGATLLASSRGTSAMPPCTLRQSGPSIGRRGVLRRPVVDAS